MRAFFGAWLLLAPGFIAGCQPVARAQAPEQLGAPAPPKASTKVSSAAADRPEAGAVDRPPSDGSPGAGAEPALLLSAGALWQFVPTTLVDALPTGLLSSSDVGRFTLRPTSGAGDLFAVLDDQAPRPLAAGTHLGALVLEDRELAPGTHVLTVFRQSSTRQSLEFQAGTFAVDQAGPEARQPWPCVVVSPPGTQNGTALPVEWLVLPVVSGVETVDLTATASWGSSQLTVPAGTAANLVSQQSGDIVLRAWCRRPDDAGPTTVLERIVTLNRELEALRGKP